ncbi:MAG: ferrous iron transport protein A [Chloroflexi bacterium]|nr:ferrous iron transport protein A [Chloroflexota bacterium]
MLHHEHTIPLSMVTPGETVELVHIHGGQKLRKRLADLGLNVGMTVRVMQGDTTGPMIVAVKGDTRLALGRGITHHVVVIAPGQSK